MKLVTFVHDSVEPRFGVWDGDLVIEPNLVLRNDLVRRRGQAAALHAPYVPSEMVAFFESGVAGHDLAKTAVSIVRKSEVAGDRLEGVRNVNEVQLLAPVPRPRRLRDYLTYRQHASGSGLKGSDVLMAMPVCYQGNVETIVGPEDELLWPSYSDQLDFELEIGFFCGAGGRNLSPKEASRRIAGVTLFNDVSARDIQFFEMEVGIGISKGKHFCSAMGPCVLTMDEVDEWAIEMRAVVNREEWIEGTSKDRHFSFSEVLSWASLDEDVYPGEFMGVGTVGHGCGLELDRWIRPGDVVELTATGIGTLRNTVGRREPRPSGILSTYAGAPRKGGMK